MRVSARAQRSIAATVGLESRILKSKSTMNVTRWAILPPMIGPRYFKLSFLLSATVPTTYTCRSWLVTLWDSNLELWDSKLEPPAKTKSTINATSWVILPSQTGPIYFKFPVMFSAPVPATYRSWLVTLTVRVQCHYHLWLATVTSQTLNKCWFKATPAQHYPSIASTYLSGRVCIRDRISGGMSSSTEQCANKTKTFKKSYFTKGILHSVERQ